MSREGEPTRGVAVWVAEEYFEDPVAEAIQRLRILGVDIQQQGTVDPALIWIGHRVREIEELLDRKTSDGPRVSIPSPDPVDAPDLTFLKADISEVLMASPASAQCENSWHQT